MSRGQLRVYLGAAPGVGKTYKMLEEGRRRQLRGADVVVGCRPAACSLGGPGMTYGRWLDESARALVGAQSALLRASVGDYPHAAEVVDERDRCLAALSGKPWLLLGQRLRARSAA